MINPLFFQQGTINPTGQVSAVQPKPTVPTPIQTPTAAIVANASPANQPQPTQPIQPVNVSTGNPALQQVIQNANTLIADFQAQGGVITPEIQQRIQSINDKEGRKAISIAEARTAADSKDATKLDEAITRANEAETTQQSELQSLLDELKTARESYITSLQPTQAEQDLGTRLNTLRTERQLLPIELRQEGISASGIAGRQVEDERVRAIQEQNLLLELGLKQDARKMTETALEKQTSFIMDDINLRMEIEETLQKQEDSILEQARNLREDSLSAMSDILTSFKGLAFSDLDPQSQADLLDTAKQFNIPAQLLADAMANAKQQQVFGNAIKQQNAKVTDTGVAGVISPRTQAIINNPSLFDDLTPTYKEKVISELQMNGYDTSNLGAKGLSDTAIKNIADTQKAIADLNDLRIKISENLEFIGPITGLQALNPWSKARKVQADVDRVKQTVGKALEGGVLRKEDEEKYKKILATVTDTPETAFYKIDALLTSIQRDIENYKLLQGQSGKSLNVKESLKKEGEAAMTPEEMREKYGY